MVRCKSYWNNVTLLLSWSHRYKISAVVITSLFIITKCPHILNDNGYFSIYVDFFFPLSPTRFTIWVTQRVSLKKQELLPVHEHLGSLPVFFCGVSFTHHFSFLCCVVLCFFLLFVFVLFPMSPVSLDCPFCFACIRPVSNVASVSGLSTLDCPFCFVCIRPVPNVASVSGLSTLDCPFWFFCIRPVPNVASVSGLSTLDCPFGYL